MIDAVNLPTILIANKISRGGFTAVFLVQWFSIGGMDWGLREPNGVGMVRIAKAKRLPTFLITPGQDVSADKKTTYYRLLSLPGICSSATPAMTVRVKFARWARKDGRSVRDNGSGSSLGA